MNFCEKPSLIFLNDGFWLFVWFSLICTMHTFTKVYTLCKLMVSDEVPSFSKATIEEKGGLFLFVLFFSVFYYSVLLFYRKWQNNNNFFYKMIKKIECIILRWLFSWRLCLKFKCITIITYVDMIISLMEDVWD